MSHLSRLCVLLLLSCSVSFSASTNDAFASRVVLTGTAPGASANFIGATIEPGEPHSYAASLWWEWTSPVESGAFLRVFNVPNALVYTGAWPNLTLVSTSNISLNPDFGTFRAIPGETYYLAAAGPTSSVSSVNVQVRLAATNDTFVNAAVISGTNIDYSVRLEGSTLEPGEPVIGTNVIGTVWWKWTPNSTNRLIIEALHRDHWVNMALYRGTSLTNLELVASADDRFTWSPYKVSRITLHPDDSTYYIAVESLGYYPMLATRLTVRTGQPNDDFADRFVLPSLTSTQASGHGIFGATLESGEPPLLGAANASIWYEWTAPTNGPVAIFTGGQSPPQVEVFVGDTLTNLVRVTPLLSSALGRYLSLQSVEGQTYFIRVSGSSSAVGVIQVAIKPGPPNDDFAAASPFQVSAFGTTGSLLGATFEAGESIRSNSIGGSVWWKWIPTNSGPYFLEVMNLNASLGEHQFALDIYTGDSLSNLVFIAGASTLDGDPTSRTTIRALAGQPYYLRVSDQNLLSVFKGTINFILNVQPGPINDDFANATLVTNEVTTGTTHGATSEPGEPPVGVSGQTVWYRWMPEFSRGHEFEVSGNTGGNVLSLYEGASLENLTLRLRLDAAPGTKESRTFLADHSKVYYVAITGQAPTGDTFQFRIIPAQANDLFADRAAIAYNQPVPFSTIGATKEPNEPSPFGGFHTHSLWYEWTAETTGGYFVEIFSAYPSPEFAIYQGDSMSNLVALQTFHISNSSHRTVSFRATAGEKYIILLSDYLSRTNSFHLRSVTGYDDFALARDIDLFDAFEVPANGATLEPGEPVGRTSGGTLWHRFTAPVHGTYVVVVNGGSPSVYRGNALTNLTLADPYSKTNLPANIYTFRASPFEPVHIAVALHEFSFNIQVLPGAANDDFIYRAELTSQSTTITNAAWSTLEPDEPLHSTNFLAGSLWWKWTPATSGVYRLQTLTYQRGSALAVYTGTNLTNLTLVANSEVSGSSSPTIDLFAEAGVEYSIVSTHVPGFSSSLTLEIHTPPAHDSFSAALPLVLGQYLTNNFVVATTEPGETWANGGTLWYSWTAPSSGSFLPSFTVLSAGVLWETWIFTGTNQNDLALISHRQGAPMAFRAVEGATYFFALTFPPDPDVRTIYATILPGHPNDDFTNPMQLSGILTGWTNNTVGATTEPGEEFLSNNIPASVWAQWTAPTNGTFRIVTTRVTPSVYRGDSLTNLQQVSVPEITATARFQAEAGVTYFIRLASQLSQPFTMRLGPVPPNESASGAIELTGNDISLTAENWVAITPGFPQVAGTLWYKWTAPAHGFITLGLSTNLPAPSISIYHSRTPTLTSNLVDNEFQSPRPRRTPLTNVVTDSVTYYFALRAAPTTNLVFKMNFAPAFTTLGDYTGALLGGNAIWFAQTNTVYSEPDALGTSPITGEDGAWIEMVINGPGTLRFRTKALNATDIIFTSNPYIQRPTDDTIGYRRYSGPHDWTLRSVPLTGKTNVIRFTAYRNFLVTSGRAWLDDLEFIPPVPKSPRLSLLTGLNSTMHLNLVIEPSFTTTLDTSTNLVDWLPWTNLLSTSTLPSLRSITIPAPTNDIPQFFRARIEP